MGPKYFLQRSKYFTIENSPFKMIHLPTISLYYRPVIINIQYILSQMYFCTLVFGQTTSVCDNASTVFIRIISVNCFFFVSNETRKIPLKYSRFENIKAIENAVMLVLEIISKTDRRARSNLKQIDPNIIFVLKVCVLNKNI